MPIIFSPGAGYVAIQGAKRRRKREARAAHHSGARVAAAKALFCLYFKGY